MSDDENVPRGKSGLPDFDRWARNLIIPLINASVSAEKDKGVRILSMALRMAYTDGTMSAASKVLTALEPKEPK